MAARTFTPAEANSALPRVRPVAERIVTLRARLRELEKEQREVVQIVAGNGSGYGVSEARTTEFAQLARELSGHVEHLNGLGVHVKDLDIGLLDFPAVRDGEDVLLCWRVGEDVLLCWRVGEDAVEWWHGLEEGYAGRKPVDWGDA